MISFGEFINGLRKEKGIPLRKVSAFLDIDQAVLSKIEHGKRIATREMVIKLAEFFSVNKDELLIAWLSDNIVNLVKDDKIALQALMVAEEKVLYGRKATLDRGTIIKAIGDYFKQDGRVSKAWIFGSFARREDLQNSDIDLMVRYSRNASGTLLDYADIKLNLEEITGRPIDLVEEGYVRPFATESIDHDKILIYG